MANNNNSLQAFLSKYPDIEIFEIILPDVCGGLRGKWVTRDKIHKVIAGELKLPLSSLAFDVWGRDGEAWVFESGDGDGFCEADIDTLVPVPWLQRSTAQLVISMRELDGEPCSYDTRHILRTLMAL
jgi:glutamine synthetase